jgi:hypothetical protein
MIIKDEFKKLIPPLAIEEFNQLEKNIIADGCRDPLLTWNGILIDGHNRYEICIKHGLAFSVVEKEFASESNVKEWMINNQFGRRNLSNYQRSVLALELEGVFSERAKENLKVSGENFGKGCQISDKAIVSIDTKKEVAKVANVSHDTIAKVKKIEAVASEEVKERLNTGEISINEAYKGIKKVERAIDIEKQREDIANNVMAKIDGLFEVIIRLFERSPTRLLEQIRTSKTIREQEPFKSSSNISEMIRNTLAELVALKILHTVNGKSYTLIS